MPAPDWSDEIAALRAGLASGEAVIQGADGRRTEYKGTKDLLTAIDYFERLAAPPKTAAVEARYRSPEGRADFDRWRR